MSENFAVEIISPDKSILKSEASEVTIPSYEGQMGILKDHIPLITFLRPGLIVIKENSVEKRFFVEDGTIEFSNNNLLILTSTAKNLDNLDKNSLDVIIKNSILKDNVNILDGCIIGKKGFGFFPNKDKNTRYPHIGFVIINENCEIGCGSTIDRGSLSNTIIGKNTYLDNQVHIAHNNKIGENCIIAGQVGFAGSSTLGNNVMIGGQAGVSGHLKVGNNVQIGGGSGVINDIPDNTKVMGYPAKNLREFIKNNRW